MALTPDQLKDIPNGMVALFRDLEDFIIKDFARRLKKAGEITSSAEWQAIRANEIGISTNYIKKELERIMKLSDKELEVLFKQSALESINADNKIFINGGLDTIKVEEHPFLKELLDAAIKQTNEELSNLTGSLGFAEVVSGKVVYSSIAKFYQKQLDLASMKILTGVTDYNSAIRQAVKALTNSGIRYVDYASGWSNRIDVAVRRSIMTGINQMASKMVEYNCDVLGVELVEVSAHGGARPSHQEWQGQVYTRGTATDKYENFEDATQYGEATGLCGVNCRHSFSAYIEGTVRTYTEKQLKEMKEKTVECNGKTYTDYEASQYQRKLERDMRQQKREILAYNEAGLKKDFDNASIKLQQLRREYNKFAETTGMKKQDARHQVEGFGRGIAQKSGAVAINKVSSINNSDIIKIKEEIKSKGIKGVIDIPPKNVDISGYSFDSKHIYKERGHNITKDEAIRFIKEAEVSLERWKGESILYISQNGTTYINTKDKNIRTAYKKEEFDDKIKFILEVISKYGD